MLGRSVAFSSSSCQRPALGRRYESAAAAQVRLTATQRLVREDVLRRDRPEDWQEVQCLCGEMQGLVLSDEGAGKKEGDGEELHRRVVM